MTDSLAARQRWAQSHYLRTSLTSHLYEYCGMTYKEDLATENYPSRIRKDQAQMESLISAIKSSKNPFIDCEDDLFNISSGKAATYEVRDYLLSIFEKGKVMYEQFVQCVIDDPANFEKPIKRQKISNFASMGAKVRCIRNQKVEVVKMERNLMGRLLILAIQNKIDMAIVLGLPMTPLPLVYGHPDGSLNKTAKSVLFHLLEAKVKSFPPKTIDVLIIDGFFFLHQLSNSSLPKTFGKVVRELLVKLCRTQAKIIHLIFDRILTPSIKDVERDLRATDERSAGYRISGPDQTRPQNFIKELRNDNFKREFVKFLCSALEDSSLSYIFSDKTVYVTQDSSCYSFIAINGTVIKKEEPSFFSSHEEADTRMIAHLATVKAPATVVIKTSDTDVLVIAIANHSKLTEGIHCYLEVGQLSKNTNRYVDVTKISLHLGISLSNALAGWHAEGGNDFNPSYAKKGKKKPFEMLENDESAQSAFASLGLTKYLSQQTIDEIEKFVCQVYIPARAPLKLKKVTAVNDLRHIMFLRSFKPTGKKPFSGLKGIDGSAMPPCRPVLYQQIQKAHFISFVWNNATKMSPGIKFISIYSSFNKIYYLRPYISATQPN